MQSLHKLAVNGDTITLPAGTFTWNRQIHIRKNITLAGAGPGVTIIYDNVSKVGGGDGTVPMLFTGISGNLRVTGFTVRGKAQDTNNFNKGTIVVTGTSHSVRIDHVNVVRPGTGAFLVRGVWGVSDHCYVDGSNFKQGWQICGAGKGDEAWEGPTNLGSGGGFYIENCTFRGNGIGGAGATDATFGARIVFRHNAVINSKAGMHGTESTRNRGVRSYEFYQNTFTCSISALPRAILLRGGTGVIWGNTFRGGGGTTGYTNVIATDNYRSWNTWQPWGRCNGNSPWDGNTNRYGYPAIDQVGRGMALDRIRGLTPINQRTGTAAWPRNQLEPVYVWSNRWTPIPNNPGVLIANNRPLVQTGRDIINNGNIPKPGYQPYTYPHPLVSAMESARLTVIDLNGDSSPDFVLQNAATQQTSIWYLDNNVLIDSGFDPTLPGGWGLASAADFNRDGHTDYALFNSVTGQTMMRYLSGLTVIGAAFGPRLSTGWELAAVADFNGDSKADYVLYEANTGQTEIWYFNNNFFINGGPGPTLSPDWSLIGAADFNRDGHPDYALFNSITNEAMIVYLSGGTQIGVASGPTVTSDWSLVATADFNGDGYPDYVLYNPSTRQTSIWYLNGNVYRGSAQGPTLPAGWSLSAP